MALIHNRREAREWQEKYDPGAPKVGEDAPDFELRDTSGESPLRLSSLRGKQPAALIFGSFT
jgi:hypothetical protein